MPTGIKHIWFILIGSIVVNNLILTRFLGICALFCPAAKLKEFLKIGAALIAVMVFSSGLCWIVHYWVLPPLHMVFFKLPVFVILTAVSLKTAVFFLKRASPDGLKSFGDYLLLFTAHCTVLGITLLIIEQSNDFLQATAFALGSGLGGLAVMLIFSAARESIRFSAVPRAFKGGAIDLVTLSLMSLAFSGFIGFLALF